MSRTLVFLAGRDPIEERGGGHSTYVRAHARAAIRAGFAPHIFCVSARTGVVNTDFGVVHQIPSPFRRLRRLMQPELRNHLVFCHAPRMVAAVEAFLRGRGRNLHLVHGFGVSGYVGVEVGRRLSRKGTEVIPVVSAFSTNVHESAVRARAVRQDYGRWRRTRYRLEHLWTRLVVDAYERQTYSGSRLVLINYESVRRLLEECYGVGGKCRKVPYTSESAFPASAPAPDGGPAHALGVLRPIGAPLAVAVSRHDPRKGVDVLLRALARLRAANLPFRACLVGPGPLRIPHTELAERLGLSSSVAITGFVPDPFAYLRHADVYVLPSLEEGSGSLALIEAMQAGVACVVSDLDGLPEDVIHGENALLVAPGDPAGLADALARVLTDEMLRRRLAAAARQTFATRFSAETFTQALRDTYADFGFVPS